MPIRPRVGPHPARVGLILIKDGRGRGGDYNRTFLQVVRTTHVTASARSRFAPMTRHARQRLRIVLATILCLLFQQAALAAYLCPLDRMPTETAAMAEHCAAMGMKQAQDNPALCEKHCAPDVSVASDHAPPTVPALALAPLLHALVLAPPASHVALQAEAPIAPTGPPPRLRYCSLLI